MVCFSILQCSNLFEVPTYGLKQEISEELVAELDTQAYLCAAVMQQLDAHDCMSRWLQNAAVQFLNAEVAYGDK